MHWSVLKGCITDLRNYLGALHATYTCYIHVGACAKSIVPVPIDKCVFVCVHVHVCKCIEMYMYMCVLCNMFYMYVMH